MFSSSLIISLILTFLGYTQQLLLNLLNLKMIVKDWKTKNVSNDEIKKQISSSYQFLKLPWLYSCITVQRTHWHSRSSFLFHPCQNHEVEIDNTTFLSYILLPMCWISAHLQGSVDSYMLLPIQENYFPRSVNCLSYHFLLFISRS